VTALCQLALSLIAATLRTMGYMLRPPLLASLALLPSPPSLLLPLPSLTRSARVRAALLTCALCLGLATAAPAATAHGDPPARVGHASVVGDSLEHSKDGNTWQPALAGMPLTGLSTLRTAQSRAELRIGSTALRMAPQVQLQFEQLDDAAVVVALHIGRLNVRLRQCCQGGDRLAVLMDGARFDATSAGSFHLDTNARALKLTVRVYAGSGTLTLGSQRIQLTAGQQVLADTQTMRVIRQGPAERNPIDDWADVRDAAAQASAEQGGTALYVPVEVTGAALLDEHGAWRNDPRWGPVWFPRGVAADWAPYRQGRWAWVEPWGWTWVDNAPWGFAPFHYGRWTFLAGRWGWLPGNAQARPVYAPALVGFYGTPPGGWGHHSSGPATGGAAGSAAAAAAAIGWYPLGPGELYRLPGNGSTAYLQALNQPHVQSAQDLALRSAATSPTGADTATVYRYAQTSFAATVVPRAVFEGGLPVAPARLDIAPTTLAGAPALGSGAAPAGPGAVPRAAPKLPR
jgi:hypothetical protein